MYYYSAHVLCLRMCTLNIVACFRLRLLLSEIDLSPDWLLLLAAESEKHLLLLIELGPDWLFLLAAESEKHLLLLTELGPDWLFFACS